MTKKERELIRDMKRRWAVQCRAGELFCFLCGEQIKNMKDCNADHWMPLALGGGTTEKNIKPAHIGCNSAKGCMSPEEFLAHRDEIIAKAKKRKKEANKLKKITKRKLKADKKKALKVENRKKETSRAASYKIKQTYGLGERAYYIKEDRTNGKHPKFEIRDGIILGFTYKNEVRYALVKNIFINQQGKVETELVDVTPLTKHQAVAIKMEYEKLAKALLEQAIQNKKTLEH